MPASLRELPKKHFKTKLQSFILDILKKHDDYIDISQITSALKNVQLNLSSSFKHTLSPLVNLLFIFIFIIIVLYDCSAQTSSAICGPVVFTMLDIYSINKSCCCCCRSNLLWDTANYTRLYNNPSYSRILIGSRL